MNWYYLKLGLGNTEAESRLGHSRPTAAIFFGKTRVKDLLIGTGSKQGQDFCKAGLSTNRKKVTMVVAHRGTIWILEPMGEVKEGKMAKYADGTSYIPKIMPVKVLKKIDTMEVPAVLAGISANANLGRGTFREIIHWGDIKAIESVLGRGIPKEHKNEGPEQLLECLSSVELETLVAKLFEAQGCFVAAYRGGTTFGVDIVAHNDAHKVIQLGGITIPPGKRTSVQVKGWRYGMVCPEEVDYLIGLGITKGPKSFDAEWLLDQVLQFPKVSSWLRRSLNWLPSTYLDLWGI